jgi:PIN domain nuclease of toxin-antitoxin system
MTTALRETWGRDPFDRLIVAQAKVNEVVLVTKDETIRSNYGLAVW